MIRRVAGFTLLEVLLVIAIVGLLVAVSVPRLSIHFGQARASVCTSNRIQFQRMYEAHLVSESKEHSPLEFHAFREAFEGAICPVNGIIQLVDGQLYCSVHRGTSEDDSEEPAPFL